MNVLVFIEFIAMISFHLTLIALASVVATRLLLNWNRLISAPGPFLAGVSDVWRAYHQYRGTLRAKLLLLHKKHGPIVRYGVNSVSISDPSAIGIVYGSRAGFVTVRLSTVSNIDMLSTKI
jgi:hypothetical protein